MSPSTAPAPVLDLDAELLKLDITYQGKKYDLRSRSELSILEAHQFSTLMHEYSTLSDIEELDDETAVKLGESLQKIATTLVKGEPPKGGFPEQLCSRILAFWTDQHKAADGPPPRRPRRAPQDRLPKQPKKKTSTGAK